MRYLITGAGGMLGHDLQRSLAHREVTALGRTDLDVTDPEAVRVAVAGHDVIINASAYTKVDAAEDHEDEAFAVNAQGTENLAKAADQVGARFVTISTDYVFSGQANTPYPENTPRAPLNAYGRSKAAGEELALAAYPDGTFIVRTAWLYGEHGGNFPKTMVRLAASHDTVSVVNDQRGQPTWTHDLADQIVTLLDHEAPAGIYHGTNSGETTWYDFAKEVFRLSGLDPERVLPTDSSAFVSPAPRPSYSVLGHDGWARAAVEPMRPWADALADAARRGVLTPAP